MGYEMGLLGWQGGARKIRTKSKSSRVVPIEFVSLSARYHMYAISSRGGCIFIWIGLSSRSCFSQWVGHVFSHVDTTLILSTVPLSILQILVSEEAEKFSFDLWGILRWLFFSRL